MVRGSNERSCVHVLYVCVSEAVTVAAGRSASAFTLKLSLCVYSMSVLGQNG